MPLLLTDTAKQDIRIILTTTLEQFGQLQVKRYTALLDRLFALIEEAPERPGSRARDEVRSGLRSMNMSALSERRSGASHIVYYRTEYGDGPPLVIVYRILHERMDPDLHLGSAP